MKRSIIIIAFLLLAQLHLALADTNIVEMNDLLDEPVQAVQLVQDEAAEFSLDGHKSIFFVKELNPPYAKIQMFIDYENDHKGMTWPLKQGYLVKADLNRDNVSETLIKIHDFGKDKDGNPYATFVLTYYGQPKLEITGDSVEEPAESTSSLITFYAPILGIGLFILVSILSIAYFKRGKDGKESSPDNSTE